MTDTKETPWYTAFPEPRNKSPAGISKEDLLRRMQAGERSGREFLLVDLRRNDYEGGTIRGSLNLPAQSLYPTLPTLLELCRGANVKQVFFYCGSSAGRGTRAAGWFDDLLADADATNIQSMILKGGIKGWATAGKEYQELMEGFDPAYWEKFAC